jgi:hypothetical protein
MWLYLTKVLLSAAVIVAVTEVARRSSFWAAVLVSLPLTSLLAFVWLHVEGSGPDQIARLATSTFWLVLPSLVLFVALPLLLRAGVGFWFSLAIACGATAAAYGVMAWVLARLGVAL